MIIKARTNPENKQNFAVVDRKNVEKKEKQIERLKTRVNVLEVAMKKTTSSKTDKLIVLEQLKGRPTVSMAELNEKILGFHQNYPEHEIFLDGDMMAIVAYPKAHFPEYKKEMAKPENIKKRLDNTGEP
jgi:hypothetical protein